MTDQFDRGMMQDRLIDLVHGTGSAASRAEIEQAVAADPELEAELGTLRQVHATLRHGVPVLDVDRIVAAIPAPSGAPRVTVAPRWQWAAAVAAIALGGMSLAVVNAAYTGMRAGDLARPVAESTMVASAGPGALAVTFGQGLTDFGDAELDELFDELARFDGLVAVEPVRAAPLPPVVGGGD
jgi:anti-sigma factor RsiW